MWPTRNPRQRVAEWHWRDDVPVHVVPTSDSRLPEELLACGRWVAALVGASKMECDDPGAYLAFDDETGRLYFVLPPRVRAAVRDLWDPDGRTVTLGRLARYVGGSHQGSYPDVEVQDLGAIATIEYFTRKYGHDQGAEGGAIFTHDHEFPLPHLACDEEGGLWYAGGSYDASPVGGITG